MALVRCPECGGEASERAWACPGCGYPVARDAAVVTRTMLAVGIAATLLLVAALCCVPVQRWSVPGAAVGQSGAWEKVDSAAGPPQAVTGDAVRYRFTWLLAERTWWIDSSGAGTAIEARIRWPIVLAEQAAILALAGAALAVLIRRQRRRRAALTAR